MGLHQGKKILVTGGCGFIGSYLVERLISEGNEVVVIDDLSTGIKTNIEHLLNNKYFQFINDTIFNYRKMEEVLQCCDEIYHLAASVGVKYVVEHPVESIRINIRGTEIVLELASRYHKKVFIASSSEVYGKNEKRILSEDDDSLLGGPKVLRWNYGHAKAIDEFLALAYHMEKGLEVVVGRLFNTCGPRQVGTYGMVIPRFIEQALRGDPIMVYGNGKQVRAFCHVSDTIEGILRLMNHPKAVGDVFNIGNPEGITIFELAKKIQEKANSKSKIILVPYEKAFNRNFEDIHYRVPDIRKIGNLTGYSPKVALDQLLEQTIVWFKEKLEKNR